jgi:hypothetical protein
LTLGFLNGCEPLALGRAGLPRFQLRLCSNRHLRHSYLGAYSVRGGEDAPPVRRLVRRLREQDAAVDLKRGPRGAPATKIVGRETSVPHRAPM